MEFDIKYQIQPNTINNSEPNFEHNYDSFFAILLCIMIGITINDLLLGMILFVLFPLVYFFGKKYFLKQKKVITKRKNLVGKLCHDTFGNVYLDVKNKYFIMTIDKNNDIEFYEVNETKMAKLSNSKNLKYDKIVDTEVTSLKKKIYDDIEKNEDSDQEEDFQNYKQKIKYLNEDKHFCKEEETNENDSENEIDEYFEFSKNQNNDSILLLDKGFDTFAIYDTFVWDARNNNVVESFVFNNTNSYRISFYKKEKTIDLNIIGNIIKTYHLYYHYDDNENIVIVCKNIDKKNNY